MPAVEEVAHGVVLGVIQHFLHKVALRGGDVVADGDFFILDLEGVEADGGVEAPFRFQQPLQLTGGAARALFVVDNGRLPESSPIVAPDGAVARRGYGVEPHAHRQPPHSEYLRVASLHVVVLSVLQGLGHFGWYLRTVGHDDGLHGLVQTMAPLGDVSVGVARGEGEDEQRECAYKAKGAAVRYLPIMPSVLPFFPHRLLLNFPKYLVGAAQVFVHVFLASLRGFLSCFGVGEEAGKWLVEGIETIDAPSAAAGDDVASLLEFVVVGAEEDGLAEGHSFQYVVYPHSEASADIRYVGIAVEFRQETDIIDDENLSSGTI